MKAALYIRPEKFNDFFEQYKELSEQKKTIKSFYQKRHYSAAWLNTLDMNENAGNFINLLNQEKIFRDEESEPDHHQNEQDRVLSLYKQLAGQNYKKRRDSLAVELDLLLTVNFFDYAKRNWGILDDSLLKKVNWFIERKEIDYEQLLDTFLRGPKAFAIHEPVYRQFGLLKKELKKYNEIAKKGGWPLLPEEKIKLKKGDTSELIVSIKKQLFITGDLPKADYDSIYNEQLEKAVIKFQERHGLEADGTIAEKTMHALRVPVEDRIEQILINMERSKWVPHDTKGTYLAANIPEFKVHVYDHDTLAFSMNVIVGKSDPVYNTVIFNDTLDFIVFSPYWNIPKQILHSEIIPEIKKNPRYINSHNLEVVDNKGRNVSPYSLNWNNYDEHFPYILRERPGKDNSLGAVKFLFPNPYDIYFHDTPAKSLFKEPARAFSHGCVRLEEPQKLAKFLLKDEPGWTDEKIEKFMTRKKETFIKLKKKVPVFIAYFTAFVNKAGELNFREDVYGHDEKMKDLLIVNY